VPQALPALGAAFAKFFTAAAIKKFVITALIQVALSLAARALSGRPKGVGQRPEEITTEWSASAGNMVFGQRRVAGMIEDRFTSGEKNKFLHLVVMLARHQVEEIGDIWIDDNLISSASINSTTGAVTSGRLAGKLYIWKHLGTDAQTADAELIDKCPDYDSNYRARGNAYLHIRCEFDEKVWDSGAPQAFYAMVKGQRVYDPRKDSTNGGSGSHRVASPTTWEWSNNWALCVASYLTGGSLVYDVSEAAKMGHLGYGIEPDLIDWPLVITAANLSDESVSGGSAPPSGAQARYTCDGIASTGNQLDDNLDQIRSAGAGQVVPVNGRFCIFGAAYETPAVSLNEDDLAGDLSLVPVAPRDKRYNAVRGTYYSATAKQDMEFRARQDASYVIADGDREEWRDIELPFTTDEYRAQRLAEIALNQSRNLGTLRFPGSARAMKVSPWQTVNVSIAELGYVNKVFRCIERTVSEDGSMVDLDLRMESSGSYADPATADYITPDALPGATNPVDSLAPPTAFTATSAPSAIVLQWNLPSPYQPGTVFDLYEYTAAVSFGDATKIATTTSNNFTLPKSDTTQRYYWLKARNGSRVSDNVPSTTGLPGKAASIAAGLSASASVGSILHEYGDSSSATSTDSVTITPTGGTPGYTYAWTHVSGSTDITVTSASAATTTFGVTGLADNASASAIKRCTVTDSAAATYTVDVSVQFSRDDAGDYIAAPYVSVFREADTPTDAYASFKLGNDGKWYEGSSAATEVRGDWCLPNGNAGLYSARVTRTGGSETSFYSGTNGSWESLATSRTWVIRETTNDWSENDIAFTIEIALTSDTSTVLSATMANDLSAKVRGAGPEP
jgi:hypothetical protein